MLAIRSKYKRWFIFFIIVLSGYTGYRLSNFNLREPRTVQLETREALSLFREAENYRKTTMSFTVNDIGEAMSIFQEVRELEGVTDLRYDYTSNGLVSVLSVPEEATGEAETILRKIPGLVSENTTIIPKSDREPFVDIETRIKHNEAFLKRLEERKKNPNLSTREIAELLTKVSAVQTTIDSLKSIPTVSESRQNSLIFATIRGAVSPVKGGKFVQYRNLALWTLGSLFAYTILSVVLYFFYELLNRLMTFIGIRSARTSSRYGGYKYGQYGGQYGYGEKRKKKKRKVYVKRDELDNEEEDEDRS